MLSKQIVIRVIFLIANRNILVYGQGGYEVPRSDEFEFFLVLYIVLGFFSCFLWMTRVNFILHPLGYRYVISVILISKVILKKCNDFICVFNKHIKYSPCLVRDSPKSYIYISYYWQNRLPFFLYTMEIRPFIIHVNLGGFLKFSLVIHGHDRFYHKTITCMS